MEIELKLLVDPADADALRRHPLLQQYAAAPPHEQHMVDTYFDTPERHFWQCHAGLRVRCIGDQCWQTLKGGGDVNGGLHRRHEWEEPLMGAEPRGTEPNLATLRALVDPKSPWGKLLRLPGLEQRLALVFSTRVTRTAWDLRLPQGDVIACAFDQGKLECGDETIPVSELELQLASGDPIQLFDLALALQQDIAMQIGTLDKAERGYAMSAPVAHSAVKAAPVKLEKRGGAGEAFRAIAVNCVAQMQANVAGVCHNYDLESLHQMRVGLRRLRSVLALFKDVVQLPDDLAQELEWLADELGAARDWDVLAEASLAELAARLPGEQRLVLVRQAALDASREPHAAAAAAAGSARYTRLVLGLSRWLHGALWRDAAPQAKDRLDARLSGFADKVLRRAHQKLRKRGGERGGASPKARHRVRIAAKKARYTIEFFESLYRQKQVGPYVNSLACLQEEFGKLNDAVVADGLLAQLRQGRKELAGAIDFVRALLASRLEKHERKARKRWKRFRSVKLPR